MTRLLGCAVDFGTTNSSVALVFRDRVELVPLSESVQPTIIPSAVFLQSDGVTVNRQFGDRAYQMFSFTRSSRDVDPFGPRLFTELKRQLADGEADQFTRIGDETFGVEHIVGSLLRYLKDAAERHSGQAVERVMLGHPVVFAGSDAVGVGGSDSAKKNLVAAARHAGFDTINLVEEPVAALAALERTTEHIALVVDFGGGTCDVALAYFDRRHLGHLGEIYTSGVPIGGIVFDSKLFSLKVEEPLGLRMTETNPSGVVLAFPSHIRQRLGTLRGALSILGDRQAGEVLHTFGGTLGRARLSALREIVYGGQAPAFYRAVENTKIQLSEAQKAMFAFRRANLGIDVRAEVRRPEFETEIQPMIQRIADTILSLLGDVGLDAGDVDMVMRTGGSAQLPAFVNMLNSLFDSVRVKVQPLFSTTVYGIGLHAQREWIS